MLIETASIDLGASVLQASQLMRASGMPYIMVTEPSDEGPVPLGVISAQDVAMRIVALELRPAVLTVGDVLAAKAAPTLDALLRRL